jgi:hypothetical protein
MHSIVRGPRVAKGGKVKMKMKTHGRSLGSWNTSVDVGKLAQS